MALQRLSRSLLSQRRLACQTFDATQSVVISQRASIYTSTSLCRELTEGSSTKEAPKSGFQKLKHDMTNLFVGRKSETQRDDKVDKEKSHEAHPFPDERAGSIYVQAQWQDGGVVHDVKPHGQGISLSSNEQARGQAERHMASA